MLTMYTQIKLGNHLLHLLLEEDEPRIKYGNKIYDRFENLTKDLKELSEPYHLTEVAKAANFFFGGSRFEVIEDIIRYRKNYERLLKEDARVADFGKFNVNEIHLPRVRDGHLIFYVEELGTGIPFKVTCPFPYKDPSKPFSYSLLSYA